jgi:hypothetical protein
VGAGTALAPAGEVGSNDSAGGVVVLFASSVAGGVCVALVVLFLGGGEARSPVLWIMDPSLRERMKVDCTPGRDVRCERRAVTCCGIWVV